MVNWKASYHQQRKERIYCTLHSCKRPTTLRGIQKPFLIKAWRFYNNYPISNRISFYFAVCQITLHSFILCFISHVLMFRSPFCLNNSELYQLTNICTFNISTIKVHLKIGTCLVKLISVFWRSFIELYWVYVLLQ